MKKNSSQQVQDVICILLHLLYGVQNDQENFPSAAVQVLRSEHFPLGGEKDSTIELWIYNME